MSNESALAKCETMNRALALSGPIAAALQAAGVFDQVKSGSSNLVSPMVAIDRVPEGSRISVRGVVIDPDKETYPQAGGKVALLKVALDKIARTAQVDWDFCEQVDDWNDPYRVKYRAVAIVTNFDGTRSRLIGTKVIDLRKSAGFEGEDAKGISDKELSMARKHIHPLCESKAKNRAIRSLGIPATMLKADAAKPWVITALVPDTSDPEVKRLYIESQAACTAALYGPKVLPAPRHQVIDLEPERDNEDVDPETGEVFDAAPPAASASEPWDEPADTAAPPAPRRYMLSAAELASLGPAKARWFKRLNELCQALYDKIGEEAAAEKLAVVYPPAWDPATSPASCASEEVARIGSAIKALVGG